MGIPVDPVFAQARDEARRSGIHAREGCGWAESAADAVLAPWLDNIANSHARYVAELDAACRRAGL